MITITSDSKINIDENFKIEAGPGAGKTQFLIHHIKNVVQNSKRLRKTGKIACITYTNSAAENIVKRLGEDVSAHVEVSTIHSFLYKYVVKPYCFNLPEKFGLDISEFKNHTDLRISQNDIRRWIEEGKFSTELKHPTSKGQILNRYSDNWQMAALRNWLSNISVSLNRENLAVFKADYNKAVVDENAYGSRYGFNRKNLSILEKEIIKFKKLNWRKGLVDHEDILFFTHILIQENPFILEVLKTKFPYIFIDEYQDTNLIQDDFLTQLKELGCIIGVIGDRAQSIYNFAGANIELFENFSVVESSHYVINENHRSTEQIIDFLNVIRKDIIQKYVENDHNKSDESNSKDIILIVGDRNDAFKKAEQLIDNHKKIVSLSRTNSVANEMKLINEEVKIDESIQSLLYKIDSNPNRRRMVLEFMKVVEYVQDGQIQKAIKLMETTVQRNVEFSNKLNLRKESANSLLRMMKKYEIYSKGSLYDFHQILHPIINNIKGNSISNLSSRSGIINFYKNTKYRTVASSLNLSENHSSHITIHKAKGNEYENLFVIGDKTMKEFLSNPDLEEEEHRVRYVAISRAKRKLFIQFEDLDKTTEDKIKRKYNCEIML